MTVSGGVGLGKGHRVWSTRLGQRGKPKRGVQMAPAVRNDRQGGGGGPGGDGGGGGGVGGGGAASGGGCRPQAAVPGVGGVGRLLHRQTLPCGANHPSRQWLFGAGPPQRCNTEAIHMAAVCFSPRYPTAGPPPGWEQGGGNVCTVRFFWGGGCLAVFLLFLFLFVCLSVLLCTISLAGEHIVAPVVTKPRAPGD